MGWKVCFSSMSMMAADGVSEVKLRLAGWRAKSEEPSGVVSQVVTFWAREESGRSRATVSRDFAILGFTVAPGGFGCDVGFDVARFILDNGRSRSGELQSPEVVQVDDSLRVAVGRGDDEGGDFLFFHEGEGRGGESTAGDGDRARVHDVAGGVFQGVRAVALEEATEIAVGDHAHEFAAFGIDDNGHA